jgi:hypothetical protein
MRFDSSLRILAVVTAAACAGCMGTQIEVQSPSEASMTMCSNEYNQENGIDGCWVEVYTEENMTGHCVRVYGPIEFANMDFEVFEELDGDIESIRVGPRARVELFEDAGFQGDRQTLSPRMLVTELDALSIDNDAESLKLLLSP